MTYLRGLNSNPLALEDTPTLNTNNRMKTPLVPPFQAMLLPTVNALEQLGGSGTIEEINSKVYDILKFSNNVLEVPHKEGGSISEVDYRLAWCRTYLKKFGLIENSSRGIWAFAKHNIDKAQLTPEQIVKQVRTTSNQLSNNNVDETIEISSSEDWKDVLIQELWELSPSSFERLSQRILRESGFSQVEVTGQSNDGGIDGKGILRVNGLISFHVIFQCKRYRGQVTPSQIRDFRGAMQGRAEKGLFITTGHFTKEAIKEASRDGATPIDLIAGDALCEKLKELKLGVKTELIERVEVNTDWFRSFNVDLPTTKYR